MFSNLNIYIIIQIIYIYLHNVCMYIGVFKCVLYNVINEASSHKIYYK